MSEQKQRVYDALNKLGIKYEVVEHEPVHTMEDMDRLGLPEKGTLCKNLLLRDAKGKRHFLITCDENAKVDLKSLGRQLGAGNLSFATIVMTGFMQSIPLEMEEAAYMEGADVFKVFGKIIVPLCRPSLATVAIFSFLWSYNDLFVQKIMMRDPTRYPISTLLEQISSQYGTDFGLMAASVTIIVIPVMIVYVLLQKNIIKGLTAGAVKG